MRGSLILMMAALPLAAAGPLSMPHYDVTATLDTARGSLWLPVRAGFPKFTVSADIGACPTDS